MAHQSAFDPRFAWIKISNGNLSVWESSKPLNNPLVSTKIAFEARFLRSFIFLWKITTISPPYYPKTLSLPCCWLRSICNNCCLLLSIATNTLFPSLPLHLPVTLSFSHSPIPNRHRKHSEHFNLNNLSGPMDKASDSRSGGPGFKSWWGLTLSFPGSWLDGDSQTNHDLITN